MLSKTGRQTPTPKAIHPLPSIVQPGTAGKYSIAEGRGNGKGGERVDEQTKAFANDIIEQCQKQGLSFQQMDALLLNLTVKLQSAKKELTKLAVEETAVKLKPF